LGFFCPVAPKTPADPDGIRKPAGSGPFNIAEWDPGRRATLRLKRFYGGSRRPHVDEIVFMLGLARDPCLLAVEEDRIDLCLHNRLPDPVVRKLEKEHGLNRANGRFLVKPAPTTWSVAFNHTRPAFAGPGQIPLKRAINYALDRPELARSFGYLAARRTDQLLPPPLARNVSLYPIKGQDLTAARRELARAEDKPERLVLYWRTTDQAAARVVAFNLGQLGIDVVVKYFETNFLEEKLETRGEPFDLYVEAWGWDYVDGGGFFVPLHKWRPLAGHRRYAAAIRAVDSVRGDALRAAAWADLDVELMRDDPPRASFVHGMIRFFLSPSFGCFMQNPVTSGVNLIAACKK
jgi:ABC-type oligopeptide transport system substrate-binding subunit